ncbi:uncharacterized protein EV422DRAFT_130731 [Fimicolochytrium jonesii]|uniref:uncharacterized protein n=1 Tax=Fimicolochytrium jonesii TaxID=1396493 RepID=UPI0022FEC63C|nr:uncharacterized protein EV422DRAFT_130731 [Fimicolochytrium jonesii]KAI8819035.1 hypothetical protein EV422DRAFT_130731 [Fimicolochytrium jonesii]
MGTAGRVDLQVPNIAAPSHPNMVKRKRTNKLRKNKPHNRSGWDRMAVCGDDGPRPSRPPRPTGKKRWRGRAKKRAAAATATASVASPGQNPGVSTPGTRTFTAPETASAGLSTTAPSTTSAATTVTTAYADPNISRDSSQVATPGMSMHGGPVGNVMLRNHKSPVAGLRRGTTDCP